MKMFGSYHFPNIELFNPITLNPKTIEKLSVTQGSLTDDEGTTIQKDINS